ncbi:Nucleotidylyl transferase [Hypoxylon crocopeplum]|nr:Nucleotidylyl transferase [Hypoxylon crocopeplum]
MSSQQMSPSGADNPMSRLLPPNLVSLFTQALKSYQLSNATFRVLCSLTPSSSSSADPPAPIPPRNPPNTLLVLDSSFNPPTLAHQRMALSALSDHAYTDAGSHASRVLLLLAINNADKSPKPAAFPQRLAMMYIFARDLLSTTAATECAGIDVAVTTEPYFHAKSAAIASCEFYRGEQTEIKGEGEGAMEQIYLTGFDTLIRIFNPKYYPHASMAAALDPFFAHARLRVTTRTDDEWGDATEQRAYLEQLRRGGELENVGGRTGWAGRVDMVDGRRDGEVVVSSTKVRDAVLRRDWKALELLVSEGVAAWIREEGLYAEAGT